MRRLKIRHDTLYTYDRMVSFGPQRLMMRPADTHAVRLLEATLEFSPAGETHWSYDAYGNSVALFQPHGAADHLRIINNLLIERYPAHLAPPVIDDPHSLTPIVYDSRDRVVLQPFINPVTDDDDATYLAWVRSHAAASQEPALDFLHRLNNTIHQNFAYGARAAFGTQSPAETVARGAGTCRDFAWLMIESLRRLGFAARFVTGYLHAPDAQNQGAGATHAWCEVFLPGIGWSEFDPTNALAESNDLIRVAATRTPEEAAPLSGVVLDGAAAANLNVVVEVFEPDALLSAGTF